MADEQTEAAVPRTKFKVVLLGAEGVGKTSLINRLIHDTFNNAYEPTVGVDFVSKTLYIKTSAVRFQFWDTAGQKRFRSLLPSYVRDSQVVLAFYDITNTDTFDDIQKTLESTEEIDKSTTVVLLIGNKSDLAETSRQVSEETARGYAATNGYLFREVSVKNSVNTKDLLSSIAEQLLNDDNEASNESKINEIQSTVVAESESTEIEVIKRVEAKSPPAKATIESIGVKSSSLILSQVTYATRVQDPEARRLISELVNELRLYKAECERKDSLIARLSSSNESSRVTDRDSAAQGESLHVLDRLKTFKKEYEAKYEKSRNELHEQRAKNKVQDEVMAELRALIEKQRVEITDLLRLIDESKRAYAEKSNELQQLKAESTSTAIVKNSMNREVEELQRNTLELESKIRSLEQEKEELSAQCDAYSSKLTQISTVQSKELERTEELTKQLIESEAECSKHEWTILELRAQVADTEKTLDEARQATISAQLERDAQAAVKSAVETDARTVRDKLSEVRDVWLATQKELEAREAACRRVEFAVSQIETSVEDTVVGFREFRRELATLLTDDYCSCDTSVQDIKAKCNLLMVSSKHRGLMIASLEQQIRHLITQLDEETARHADTRQARDEQRTRLVDAQAKTEAARVEVAELRGRVERHELERNKMYGFLDRLSHLYGLGITTATIYGTSVEANVEVIWPRVHAREQKHAREDARSIDEQRAVYENRLTSLNEQLASKDVHLGLLRKKLADYEEMDGGVEVNADANTDNCRQRRVIERLEQELNLLRDENVKLKASVFDYEKKLVDYDDKEVEIRRLCERIVFLEEESKNSLLNNHSLREEFEATSTDLEETQTSTSRAIKALSMELRALKLENEKLQSRNSQLLDLRNTVMNKLGLNLLASSLTDCEIIARLESSMRCQMTPVITAVATPSFSPVQAMLPCSAPNTQTPLVYTQVSGLPPLSSARSVERAFITTTTTTTTANPGVHLDRRHHHHNHHHRQRLCSSRSSSRDENLSEIVAVNRREFNKNHATSTRTVIRH